MRYFRPEKIYIEAETVQDPFTQSILSRLPGVPRQTIENSEELIREFNGKANPFTAGKKVLLLRRKKGEVFKPFPLIPEYLSCHFQILHLGMGCDLECTYCILQSYLNNPVITVFTNLEQIMEELSLSTDNRPEEFFRIGTGELIDSLSLDHITEWSVPLVCFFAERKNTLLELKTKTDNIANLKKADPKDRVMVSWSMNTEIIQNTEEFKTATLDERIRAAAQVQDWGYLAGFHFDPLIYHDGWEEGYAKVIQKIFSAVDASRIGWISLGALRFMPSLKKIAQKRFPSTRIFTGEFVRGLDGKSRYFKTIRKRLYTGVRDLIRSYCPEVPIYLCMESPELWSGLKEKITSSLSLKGYLDRAAQKSCRLS